MSAVIAAAGRLQDMALDLGRSACRWRSTIIYAFIDQGCFSSTTFLVNVMLVRWLSPFEYGCFAIAFAWYLVVAGIHTAFITEPLSVLGPAQFGAAPVAYARAVFRLHWVVSTVLGSITAAMSLFIHTPALCKCFQVLGLCMPLLLAYWLMRRIQYLRNAPNAAAACSTAYLLIASGSLACLHLKGSASGVTGILALAVASAVTSAIAWRSARRDGSQEAASCQEASNATDTRRVAGLHGRFGAGLAVAAIVSSLAGQLQLGMAAACLGLSRAGVVRALTNITLPMIQLISAMGTAALPRLSEVRLRRGSTQLRRAGLKLNAAFVGVAVSYGLVLAIWGRPLLTVLYGSKLAMWSSVVPVVALNSACIALPEGYSLTLRAAKNSTHKAWASAAGFLVGTGTALPFINAFGIAGVFWSGVAMYGSISCITYTFYRRKFHDPVLS